MNVRRQNSHTSCPRSNLLKRRGSQDFTYARTRKPHGHALAHTVTTGFSGLKIRETSTVLPSPPGFRAPSGSYTEAGGTTNLGCPGTQHTPTLSRMTEIVSSWTVGVLFPTSPQGRPKSAPTQVQSRQGASAKRQPAGSWAFGIACTRRGKVSCCL